MNRYFRTYRTLAAIMLALFSATAMESALAQESHALSACAAIEDDAARLACYDELAGRGPAKAVATEPVRDSAPEVADQPALYSPLSTRWELEPATKRGTFNFTAYRPNYFLPYHYNDKPNTNPSAPGQPPLLLPEDLDNTEAMFQLSFKVKLAEGLIGEGDDVWFGYTQQSLWQMYNKAVSSPFRNTDYEPELMYVIPTDVNLLGLRLRMVGVGLAHQSNGRGEPLSRSWNRAYAQFGFERGNFTLMVKPWYRFDEDVPDDDNPDISDYVGRGEILGVYKWRNQEFSARWRNNFQFHDNRGSIQLGWSFPLVGRLKGYAQFFNGYGETLLDYNHQQTTVGVGFLLTDWF